jgi:hypothetical protein
MKDLTKLTIKELYEAMEKLDYQLEQNLAMDGSGELGGKIMDDFQPFFDRIQKEIESRPEKELEAYIDENAPEEEEWPDLPPWVGTGI